MKAQFKLPERFRKKKLFIDTGKVEQEGNICYSTILTEDEGQAVIKKSLKQGFELEYKKITAISIKDGRVVLNPNDKLFKEGYEYVDMSKIGIAKTFPKEWLKYDPVMSMKKYFDKSKKTKRYP